MCWVIKLLISSDAFTIYTAAQRNPDIIQIQIAETSGELVKFGKGVSRVTLHFKHEKRVLPHPTEQQ